MMQMETHTGGDFGLYNESLEEWNRAYEAAITIDNSMLCVCQNQIAPGHKPWRSILFSAKEIEAKMLVIDDMESLMWECKRAKPKMSMEKIRGRIVGDIVRLAKKTKITVLLLTEISEDVDRRKKHKIRWKLVDG